jgi:tRNA A37 N6-isopentenylltransferase MiaA
VSGGTGLYLKSIMQTDEFPDVPEDIADKWTALWKQMELTI